MAGSSGGFIERDAGTKRGRAELVWSPVLAVVVEQRGVSLPESPDIAEPVLCFWLEPLIPPEVYRAGLSRFPPGYVEPGGPTKVSKGFRQAGMAYRCDHVLRSKRMHPGVSFLFEALDKFGQISPLRRRLWLHRGLMP